LKRFAAIPRKEKFMNSVEYETTPTWLTAMPDSLTEYEKTIIIHRYGLYGKQAKSYTLIGRLMNPVISKQAANQAHTKLMQEIRESNKAQTLILSVGKDYIDTRDGNSTALNMRVGNYIIDMYNSPALIFVFAIFDIKLDDFEAQKAWCRKARQLYFETCHKQLKTDKEKKRVENKYAAYERMLKDKDFLEYALNNKPFMKRIAVYPGILEMIINSEPEQVVRDSKEKIETLDLSARAYNRLKRNNINKIHDLTEKTRADLEKIRNMGRKTVCEIIETLGKSGYTLKPDANESWYDVIATQSKLNKKESRCITV
jgi:hypothetical protein